MLVPLLLGRPAPFTPAMIALLELFMDLGASVAFVAEPAAATLMRRPPRSAAVPFLGRLQLNAIGAVAVALTVAVLPAYLIAGPDTQTARAAAIGAWLAGHALIAWSLRADPRLALRRNLAFPAWALAAVVVGLAVAATPLAATLGLSALDPGKLGIVAATVLGAVVVAGGSRRLLRLGQL
ncbi:MAG: cation transporting ATPase C-terminal domain-containing protein [Mycobacteriales bacterium]